MTSIKTTVMAIASLLMLASSAVLAVMDTDPLTNPDWVALGGAASAAIGLLFARDNTVSSESAGAKQ